MSSLLLLSGGIDSALCLYSEQGIELAVGFDYGQPHAIELTRAKVLAESKGVPFKLVKLPSMEKVNDVVFAGRNAVFLSVAASIAMREGIDTVIIGCNRDDFDLFPDCRLDFIRGMNAALAAYAISVYAPLLNMTKVDVVKAALAAGVKQEETWTCYNPTSSSPCGTCLACKNMEVASV